MSQVVIIDYGSGNLRSAAKAFERAARESGVDAQVLVTDDVDAVIKADRLVLPGVGAFGDCRKGLDSVDGLSDALGEAVLTKAIPFLGICVGMQLLASESLEHGSHAGLDWIPGEVVPIRPTEAALKVPHMGWNDLTLHHDHSVLEGVADGHHGYFVHSFQFKPADDAAVLAMVDYGGPVTAVVGRDNIIGTQFHPEKSQATGLRLISNFLKWSP